MSTGDNGPVVASGAPFTSQSDGSVPLRQEIRDLNQNKKLWTLYLLALRDFQVVNNGASDAPLSYYQIAGIHGVPHVKWPNKDWNDMQPADPNNPLGFCTHNSILFLPWHRPYLALFEQALYSHVQNNAQQLTQELNDKSWTTEAQNFRIPYWDWADPNKGTFPEEALTDTVSIIQPGSQGQEQNMPNPLYRFTFIDSEQDGNVQATGSTWRISSNENPGDIAKTLVANFNDQFKARNPREKNLTERVLYVLQSYQKYGTFSNDAFRGPGQPGTYGSVEGIHNTIHNVTGGGGQMSDPDYAAFDPIFWLHHCNIDRLFAIWQALHESDSDPSTYVQPEAALQPDWSTNAGDTEDINTAFAPFWKDQQNFYTSADVKKTPAFGYAYPETQAWKFSDPSAYAADIQTQLVRLYTAGSLVNAVREKLLIKTKATPSATVLQARAKTHTLETAKHPTVHPPASAVHPVVAQRALPKASAPHGPPHAVNFMVQPGSDESFPSVTNGHDADPAPAHTNGTAQAQSNGTASAQTNGTSAQPDPMQRKIEDLTSSGKYLEWITNVKSKKHEFGASYNVHVFLGEVPDESQSVFYPLVPSHVGTYSVFTRSQDTGCERCQKQRQDGLEVSGQVMLTVALVERYLAGELDGLQPEHVVPYLQQNLHWRVTYANGTAIHRADVNSVLVSVISNEVMLPAHPTALPTYAQDVHVYPEVTTKVDGQTPRGDGTGLTSVAQA